MEGILKDLVEQEQTWIKTVYVLVEVNVLLALVKKAWDKYMETVLNP